MSDTASNIRPDYVASIAFLAASIRADVGR